MPAEQKSFVVEYCNTTVANDKQTGNDRLPALYFYSHNN